MHNKTKFHLPDVQCPSKQHSLLRAEVTPRKPHFVPFPPANPRDLKAPPTPFFFHPTPLRESIKMNHLSQAHLFPPPTPSHQEKKKITRY